MSIKTNIGIPDRLARIVLGSILLSAISLVFIGPKTPYAYMGIIGILPLVAGISGFCPPYEWLGINTYMKKKLQTYD